MEDLLDSVEYGYSMYAVVSLIIAVFYLVATVLVVFVPQDVLSATTRDYATGIFWALKYFGLPVTMFLSVFAIIMCRATQKKGTILALVGLVAPWVFVLTLSFYWPVMFR